MYKSFIFLHPKFEVIFLDNDISMLNSIRQTTQMGCHGIRSVMDETLNKDLRSDLESQMQEYESIYAEASRMLRQRDEKAKDINPLAKYSSGMSAMLQVRASQDPSSKIAALMLQGNTRGMIKSIHNLRTMGTLDPKVASLSKRLLQTEQANIDQMKQYL